MAKPRKRSGKWYARFKDETGKWRETVLLARTAAEAKEKAHELAALARDTALGLRPRLIPPCVAEVYGLYEPTARTEGAWKSKRSRFKRYILPRFGKRRLDQVTPADVEELMAEVQQPPHSLSPQSADHIRVAIASLYTYAIERKRIYVGDNPGNLARKAEIPIRAPRFLELHHLAAVLEQVNPRWVNFFAVSALTGQRMGEVKALKRSDVDLVRRLMFVTKSNARKTTKTKKMNVVPISADAVPFFEAALREAKSEWLFSDDKGRQLKASRSFVPELRRALIRAGLVVGYDVECRVRKPASGGAHGRSKLTAAQAEAIRIRAAEGVSHTQLAKDFGVSRRAVGKVAAGESWAKPETLGCGYTERRATADRGPCPNCGRPLWATPVPVEFVFHNLRSTAATHHLEATGDVRYVQALLGHGSTKTTERYAAMRPQRMVELADRVTLKRLPAPQAAPKMERDLVGIGESQQDTAGREAKESEAVGTKKKEEL